MISKSEIRLPLFYFIFGALWILISDAVVFTIIGEEPEQSQQVSVVKGVVFVTITTLFVFLLLRSGQIKQRAAAEKIASTQREFDYLFKNNPQPMWIFDVETLDFLEVNDAAAEKYGYSRAQFLTMTIRDIRPLEDMPRLEQVVQQTNPRFGTHGDWRHVTSSGAVLDVEIISYRIDFKGRPASLVMVRDITDRKRAEQALRDSEMRLESILSNLTDVVWALDVGTDQLVYLSPGIETLSGRPHGQFLDNREARREMIHPEDRSFFEEQVAYLRQHHQRSIEYRILQTDGTVRWVSDRAWAVCDESGTVIRFDGILSDITERKQLEAETLENERLRLALEKEIELRNLRDRFISVVSHEFRTPLSTIMTSTAMLERYHTQLTDDQRAERYQNIYGKVKLLTDMLDDLLTTLRSEKMGVQFKPTNVDIVAACHESIAQIKATSESSHHFRLESQHETLQIEADLNLINRALTNLLANAVKYSPEGGEIIMRIVPNDSTVTISVCDPGIGIPPDEVAHIFDAFQRASNTGAIPGTGLGLSIVRQAVELHHGEVTVQPRTEGGTCFIIALPRQQPA
jgi:PAS domain S-box-containing protein